MAVFVIADNAGMKINVDVYINNWFIKGACNEGSVWNPSNCECECDKSRDVGEYLDYNNRRCRKN